MTDYQRRRIVTWLRPQAAQLLEDRPVLRTLLERAQQELGFLISYQEMGFCLKLADIVFAPEYAAKRSHHQRIVALRAQVAAQEESIALLAARLEKAETAMRALARTYHAEADRRVA